MDIFSKTKSKVVYIAEKTSNGTGTQPLRFNKGEINYSQKEIHLGLANTADGKSTKVVSDWIQIGRHITYQVMGTGVHRVNGITPHVSKHMVSVYVNPALLCGMDRYRNTGR